MSELVMDNKTVINELVLTLEGEDYRKLRYAVKMHEVEIHLNSSGDHVMRFLRDPSNPNSKMDRVIVAVADTSLIRDNILGSPKGMLNGQTKVKSLKPTNDLLQFCEVYSDVVDSIGRGVLPIVLSNYEDTCIPFHTDEAVLQSKYGGTEDDVIDAIGNMTVLEYDYVCTKASTLVRKVAAYNILGVLDEYDMEMD